MEVEVRSERLEEIDRVSSLIGAVFGQETEVELVRKLREKDDFISELSLVAVYREKIIGHILFYPVKIKGSFEKETLCLAPMSVHPGFQNSGVGGKLVNAGLESAVKLGFGSVIVVGYPGYYSRFGFQPAKKWGLRLPFKAPGEAFMALELRKDALKDAAGVVDFPREYMEDL